MAILSRRVIQCAVGYFGGSEVEEQEAVGVDLGVREFEGLVDHERAFLYQAIGRYLAAAVAAGLCDRIGVPLFGAGGQEPDRVVYRVKE